MEFFTDAPIIQSANLPKNFNYYEKSFFSTYQCDFMLPRVEDFVLLIR